MRPAVEWAMSRYEIYLYIHIMAAIVWLGGGMMLLIQGFVSDRAQDDKHMKYVLDSAEALAKRIFIPASLTVFVMGVLMIVDGPWKFSQLWIVLGLIGYFATFVTGAGILGPMGERINARAEEKGFTGDVITDARRLLVLARLDHVLFLMIVFDMVAKPTGDDVGLLVFMALVLVLGIAATVLRARAITDRGMTAATARG